MVRNRSAFLTGLKTRLDRDMVGRARADAALRWRGAPETDDDDLWPPVTDEPPLVAEDQALAAHWAAPPDRAQAAARGADPAARNQPDDPGPTTPWSENGMPERLRAAIASVRRIANEEPSDLEDQPPEQPAPWPIPEDLPPAPVRAARRPGFRIAGFVLASALVLLVGFGVGALLAGWDLGLPLPGATAESPPATPVASRTEPSPPPIAEVVRVQPAPMPPGPIEAPAAGEATSGGLPLPPPPKPAPWSTVASEAAPGMVGDAVDAAVAALVEEGGGLPSPATEPAGPRVYVHFAASAAGGAMDLIRRLQERGFAAEARPVDFPIATPSIRYFFAADRDSAEAVSATLEGQIPGGAAPPVLDFTHFEPKPQPGNLEIWVDS